jgi:transglutaminase-like putative cysteine protease
MELPRRIPDRYTARERLREALREAWRTVDAPAVVALLVPVLAERDPRARVEVALRLVQGLPYRPDAPGEDWVQTSEFTAEHGGDCEDLAALLVVLCVSAGVPARLLWIFQRRRVRDHVTAQAKLAGVWLWMEPTLQTSKLGENPYAAAERLRDQRALGEVIQ